jgi:hypothetical protein
MGVVEVPTTPGETFLASLLLVRRDHMLGQADVRLIAEESLSVVQRRSVAPEQLNIRRDSDVRTAVPDDVASVVTDALNLLKEQQ